MQISSGWAKGLQLATPRGDTTRPTAAKVRAAALNMLAPELDGARFLDLFAGSGGMGLEAVSRGAASAVFVDQAAPAIAAVRKNIAEMERRAAAQGLARPSLTVLTGAAPAILTRLTGTFDLIFIDPPYRDVAALAPLLLAALTPFAQTGAVLLFESAASEAPILAQPLADWGLLKQRAYGESSLTMLEKS